VPMVLRLDCVDPITSLRVILPWFAPALVERTRARSQKTFLSARL
jgi:hypothetical protein